MYILQHHATWNICHTDTMACCIWLVCCKISNSRHSFNIQGWISFLLTMINVLGVILSSALWFRLRGVGEATKHATRGPTLSRPSQEETESLSISLLETWMKHNETRHNLKPGDDHCHYISIYIVYPYSLLALNCRGKLDGILYVYNRYCDWSQWKLFLWTWWNMYNFHITWHQKQT